MELSTSVYIDCLSLLTCSSYYSMRGVVYDGVLYTLSMVWARGSHCVTSLQIASYR